MRLSPAVQANPDGSPRVGHCAGHCRLLPECPDKREGRLWGQLADGGALEEIPPTPFVEQVASLLLELGHEPFTIKTERFGPSGAEAAEGEADTVEENWTSLRAEVSAPPPGTEARSAEANRELTKAISTAVPHFGQVIGER
jgi:hypothetical protein